MTIKLTMSMRWGKWSDRRDYWIIRLRSCIEKVHLIDDHDNGAVEEELSSFSNKTKMIPFTRLLCCAGPERFNFVIVKSGTQKLENKSCPLAHHSFPLKSLFFFSNLNSVYALLYLPPIPPKKQQQKNMRSIPVNFLGNALQWATESKITSNQYQDPVGI